MPLHKLLVYQGRKDWSQFHPYQCCFIIINFGHANYCRSGRLHELFRWKKRKSHSVISVVTDSVKKLYQCLHCLVVLIYVFWWCRFFVLLERQGSIEIKSVPLLFFSSRYFSEFTLYIFGPLPSDGKGPMKLSLSVGQYVSRSIIAHLNLLKSSTKCY